MKVLDIEKMMSGADGGNRTRTSEARGILSPLRLPIPPRPRVALFSCLTQLVNEQRQDFCVPPQKLSVTPDQADQLSLYLHTVRREDARLIGRVCSFERD